MLCDGSIRVCKGSKVINVGRVWIIGLLTGSTVLDGVRQASSVGKAAAVFPAALLDGVPLKSMQYNLKDSSLFLHLLLVHFTLLPLCRNEQDVADVDVASSRGCLPCLYSSR